jgi:hypothetical protein
MDDPIFPGESIARLPGGLTSVSLSLYRVLWTLVGKAIAIGDTADPVLSGTHAAALSVLGLPMFYLEPAMGWPLKRLFGDNYSIDLCMGANALFWSVVVEQLLPASLSGGMWWTSIGAELLWPGRGVVELYRLLPGGPG